MGFWTLFFDVGKIFLGGVVAVLVVSYRREQLDEWKRQRRAWTEDRKRFCDELADLRQRLATESENGCLNGSLLTWQREMDKLTPMGKWWSPLVDQSPGFPLTSPDPNELFKRYLELMGQEDARTCLEKYLIEVPPFVECSRELYMDAWDGGMRRHDSPYAWRNSLRATLAVFRCAVELYHQNAYIGLVSADQTRQWAEGHRQRLRIRRASLMDYLERAAEEFQAPELVPDRLYKEGKSLLPPCDFEKRPPWLPRHIYEKPTQWLSRVWGRFNKWHHGQGQA